MFVGLKWTPINAFPSSAETIVVRRLLKFFQLQFTCKNILVLGIQHSD